MTTAERIHLLRRHGLENAVVAAVLGVDVAEIVTHVLDPSHEVTVGGGGSVDLAAITGPLGFADGPSFAWGDSEQWGSDYPVLSVLGLDNGEFDVVGSSINAVAHDGSSSASIDSFGQINLQSPDALGSLNVLSLYRTGGAGYPFIMKNDGSLHWGDGTAALDTALRRSGGFGPGYGVLAADAGGGFQVLSSAAGNEASFIQLSPDTGYGGYVWVHDLVGRTDQDALYFDVEGEGQARFRIGIDGSMHWSDGTAATDVLLERADPEWWGGPGIMHLDTTPEARLAGGSSGIAFGPLDGSGPNGSIYEAGLGFNDPAGPYVTMGAYPGQSSVSAASDMARVAMTAFPGDNSYATLSVSNYGKSAMSMDSGARPTIQSITDWGTDHGHQMTMGAMPGVDNFLEILGGTSGLVAHSPDGTAYKLTPPNGGGAATWVAA